MKTLKLLLSVLVLLLLNQVSVAEENPIAFGPYVQNITSESAVICWSTFDTSISVADADGNTKNIPHYNNHSVELSRLKDNTRYTYDVLKDGTDFGKGEFTTFFEDIQPFSYVVFGDTRSRHDIHQRLVDRISEEKDLRMVFNTGDLVSDGANIEDWEHFFRINRELMREHVYYPVLGNHEHNASHYYEFFNLPGNEKYYTIVLGDALFLMLDSEGEEYETPAYLEPRNEDYFYEHYTRPYFEEQKLWAEHMLDMHKDAGYIYVMFHKPLICVKQSRVAESRARQRFWGDIWERHGVQVVFTGHDHHYHRAELNGVQYITTGGGGAPLYDIDAPQPESVFYKKVEHYIRVDVKKNTSDLTVTDIDGNVLETLSVKKR